MASLDDLLAVQMLDTHIDQLQHRRRTLPQRAALTAAGSASTAAHAAYDECAGRLKTLRSSEREAEDHASLLDDKATAVNASLYDGSVTSHKELESLQMEHAQLKVHQSQYEDTAIEFMEQAEPVEAELAQHQSTIDSLAATMAELAAEIVVAEAEIDAELDQLAAERATTIADVPEDVVTLYNGLRSQLGGVAVARLTGARCEGCHLEIPSAELEGLRRAPADAAITCPECGRLLVR